MRDNAGQQSSRRWVVGEGGGGGEGFVQGLCGFTVRLLRSNHFAHILGAQQFSVFDAPCPPSLCSGKFVISIFVQLCLKCGRAFGGCHSQGCHGYPMCSAHAARGRRFP